VIKTFVHKGLDAFFLKGTKAGIRPYHAKKLTRQLSRLNVAKSHEDMNLPGWGLHPLEPPLKGENVAQMHNPPHPGTTLRDDVLPALGLNITEAAKHLRVTRAALSRVLNEHAAISPEMALRIEGWLGVKNGGRADVWIAQQGAYDLWQARKAGAPKVKRATIVQMEEDEAALA
jgi:addiction module HigA family antidote